MKKFVPFLSMWLINAILLLLANMLFLNDFVLGTYRAGILASAVTASLVWTAIVYLVDPFMKKLNVNTKNTLKMMSIYIVANFVAIWLVARMAPLTGFGVSSFVWVILLAVVANVVQYLNWSVLVKAGLAENK